jgi:flagellin
MTISAATNMGAMSAKRFLESNSAKATRAVEELASGSRVSNPAYAPAEAAIGDILSAKLRSLGQASKTVSQANAIIQMATGTLGSSNKVLERMKELAGQSNADGVDDSQRKMLNLEYQQLINQIDTNATTARLGKTALFTGGAGTVSQATAVVAAETMVTGASIPSNTFGGFSAANSQGHITGNAQDFNVTQQGSVYNYSLKVGDQTFTGTTGTTIATSQVIQLRSTTDSNNLIAFTADGSDVSGMSSADAIQTAGRTMLGLSSGQAAVFTSTTVANTTYANATISAGSSVSPGSYSLEYTKVGTAGSFTLSNGAEKYTATATSAAGASMTETVTFDNGMSISLAAFDGSASLGQHTLNVAQGSQVNLSFQIGDQNTDIMAMTFKGATSSSLGISGTSVATQEGASSASTKITLAQSSISSQIAELGGKKSQLDFQSENLKIAIQNNSAIKSTFVDADMTESLMNTTKFNALKDMSSAVFQQALGEPAKIARLVQQAASG